MHHPAKISTYRKAELAISRSHAAMPNAHRQAATLKSKESAAPLAAKSAATFHLTAADLYRPQFKAWCIPQHKIAPKPHRPRRITACSAGHGFDPGATAPMAAARAEKRAYPPIQSVVAARHARPSIVGNSAATAARRR